ncbi:MAG: hypothetical protein HBSAPP03_22050 [Phycisphaerae bacterium]|nr:MAG: hypothetical protein HBSAPP03_22050 [Phycisphaerae bacterium]
MPRRDLADVIDHFVALVLGHLDREFPHKLDHVINDASEILGPRALHPIFYGSFDWHSSVHGHWLLIRAIRLFPALAQADQVRGILDARFTSDNVRGEVAYLGQKLRTTFERPYGWGWFLKLAAELRSPPPTGVTLSEATAAAFARWHAALQPLTDAFVERFVNFLPKATYPIRVGTHHNTAFALALAHDYARLTEHAALGDAISKSARAWYLNDRDYPAWEPDGIDFLSPGLVEAECMRRVLPPAEFAPWFARFLPALAERKPATLFVPATVSDRTDGQITHLDGLNLCRAWCWRSLASTLEPNDPRHSLMIQSAKDHLEAALPHVSGDYMGEHWLATFAMLAMSE